MRIFVSHSTEKADAGGKQRLLDLKRALERLAGKRTGHEVLLDFERLDPAAKWRVVLDEWMATCHAAVLVMTPKSMTSWWVLKEATILAHRAARDEQFLLFPVLLDGLTRTELTAKESRFSPLYLDALQRVGKADPKGIAGDVLRELKKLGSVPRTPFDELAADLATQMKGADPQRLEQICLTVTGKPVPWQPSEVRAERCARIVACAIVTNSKGGYQSLGAMVGDLLRAGLGKDAARTVLKLASPLWVDAEAASPLADVAARNIRLTLGAATRSWATAINGAYVSHFTADKYIRRAYMPGDAKLRSIEGGESELRAEELIARLRTEVRNTTPQLTGADDARVDNHLATVATPYFVVLPPPMPDDDVLDALLDRFPKLTFIVQADAEALVSVAGRVVPLAPALDLGFEQNAFNEFVDAEDRINRF
jgi:hypothetical protein